MSQLKNTLKNINSNNCDILYQQNKNYLNDLYKQITNLIDCLNKISYINLNQYYNDTVKPLILTIDDSNISFTNTSISTHNKLIQVLNENLDNIKLLKAVIPNYTIVKKEELKEITDEYINFHNHIINQINQYNKHYDYYYQSINQLVNHIEKYILYFKNLQNANQNSTVKSIEKIIENVFVESTNNNQLSNVSNNFDKFVKCISNTKTNENYETIINKLNKINKKLVNEINLSSELKIKSKLINNSFILELRKQTYSNLNQTK